MATDCGRLNETFDYAETKLHRQIKTRAQKYPVLSSYVYATMRGVSWALLIGL
jgi:hypothetical protein